MTSTPRRPAGHDRISHRRSQIDVDQGERHAERFRDGDGRLPSDDVLQLPDGRRLGWATYGAGSGRDTVVAVALHGAPDSRRIWSLFDAAAARTGVQLVCPDRPGFGLSSPAPGRNAADWVDDLTALVDHLEIAEFPLITISAGALAGCVAAASLPDRVTGLGLLAPLGAFDSPGATDGMNSQIRLNFWLAAHAPWLLRPIVGALSRTARRSPARALRRVLATRPAEDRVILERPEVQAVLVENLAGQFANPPSVVAELRRAVAPWPVALADITVPTQIWHGDRDDVHTPAMARHLERSIPGAKRDERAGLATFGFLDDADSLFASLTQWAARD